MARDTKNKQREVDEEEEESSEETESGAAEGGEDALVRAEGSDDQSAEGPEGDALAKREGDEGDGEEGDGEEGGGEQAAASLGVDRYVLAGFFAAGMIGAYVLGRAIQLAWTTVSNKDWFSRSVPRLAAVGDDEKATISLVIAGIIALVVVVRTYRKPDVRTWADEVAAELTKVKWPTRKEVTNSTIIVIAASAAATVYLALLDRLWAFVTNIVYGGDSS